jgi:N-acetylglucosamine-6-phosphate deacetylase
MTGTKAYISNRIFTGDEWLNEHAVIVEEGLITALLPDTELPAGIQSEHFTDAILAPAFIDLQIYGAHEKLFAVYPDNRSLELLNEYSNKGGAAYCMPTVATNEPQVFYKCIDAIKEYWLRGGQGILGLHIEGPWINKEKRGAHIESLIHSPSVKEVKALLDYGKGVIKIITLAPEVCSTEVINLIWSAGVKIFAGHSNATYEEAMYGFVNGVCGVTHLYNAMSPLQHRSPGLVGATLDNIETMASIIADGHHVDYPAISIAKKLMGNRLFAITDAVTTTTEGYYKHKPEEDKYSADGILSGSALTMYKAFRNLVCHVGISTDEALRMCSLYPARVLNMDNELGKLVKGYKAQMVLIPKSLADTEFRMIS